MPPKQLLGQQVPPVNLERVPPLLMKYMKGLRSEKITSISVTWSAGGIAVAGKSTDGKDLDLPGIIAMCKSSDSERFERSKSEFARKFEIRLDIEAPAAIRNSTNQQELDAAIAGLPFKQRLAAQMSRKDYRTRYPSGWRDGTPVVTPPTPEPVRVSSSFREKKSALPKTGPSTTTQVSWADA
jgi:hypothetical protein